MTVLAYKKHMFNINYLNYWSERVGTSQDGTLVPGLEIVDYILESSISKGTAAKILDLGCSFGRLYEVLSNYSNRIFGCDIDRSVINEAAKKPYLCTVVGQAEETPFASDTFDIIISWAVFDVVEIAAALKECHRILKHDGILIFTGKNFRYFDDDSMAFIAERNAKLKDFPNHFVELPKLIERLPESGFKPINCWIARRRGDFGKFNILPFDAAEENFVEFALVVRKSNIEFFENNIAELSHSFSYVAGIKARTAGFSDPHEYFKSHFESEKS